MDPQKKNKLTGLVILGVVAGMIALSFAAVPLYSLFCQVTGFGGTTQVATRAPGEVLEREITIQFSTDTAPDLPWVFEPEIRKLKVRIGEEALVNFTARNRGREPVAGTAIFNVTPLKTGKYFLKTQCFCFNEQILNPGQKVNMPVVFHVAPALDEDPNMDDVTTITLSYTFFQTESDRLEKALEEFYNSGAEGQTN